MTREEIDVLEIGAGESPDPRSTVTLDIRDDLDHIDIPGVDIGSDRWPIKDSSVTMVLAHQVLEHVPPEKIGHVFRETYRVLQPGGTFHAQLPHAGTWGADTDMTHQGTGGTTPSVSEYFSGQLEDYWPDIKWTANAWAIVEGPIFIRPSMRIRYRTTNGRRSYELVKIPFVTANVVFEARLPRE